MSDKTVTLSGRVAVVWYVSHDTMPDAPKRVYDLCTDNDLLDAFSLTVNVTDKQMWILDDDAESGAALTVYWYDGTDYLYDVPSEDLGEALRPPHGVPGTVWARAVYEAHGATCAGRQNGCNCAVVEKELEASGLLY